MSQILPKPFDTPLIFDDLEILANINCQQSVFELIEECVYTGQGQLTSEGALAIHTGKFTGRSPKDKYIVSDSITDKTVDWNDFNQPLDEKYFIVIKKTVESYLAGKSDIWVRHCMTCADETYRMHLRVISEKPWTDMFVSNMFIRPTAEQLNDFIPDWTILCAPDLLLDNIVSGTRSSNAAVVSFKHKMILIAGTGYTGETKKGIFSVLNYLLPQDHSVLSMHCSANIGEQGDTALFFGLSGTGKTTLSADPARRLIGDDEHGWSRKGIFNFEGGCYAKTIGLSREKEPAIYDAIRPGALLENVVFFKGSNKVDFTDASVTENTRVSYPLSFIPGAVQPAIGPHPSNIFFLTCDAYGILPPLSKLSREQAMYYFMSGYTARVAGTETGVKQPAATFSACFGAPFLPLHPAKYADLLGQRLDENPVQVWMVNTGWTGGAYGTGKRIPLQETRMLIDAVLGNKLMDTSFINFPSFNLQIPASCPGVSSSILNPRSTWNDPLAYDTAAGQLAERFIKNFKKYAGAVASPIIEAGPHLHAGK